MRKKWLAGKVAVVTGGASGIGQAVARQAAYSGAHVAVVDIDVERGNKTVLGIQSQNGKATFVKTDVTNRLQVAQMVQQVARLGRVQYLCNSAGLQTYGTAESTSIETWDSTMNVNLKSMFLVIKELIPKIREDGGGGIVNISSIQGLRCQRNVLAYATAKGAVISMTRSLGLDHAREGIYVNCICPGSVDTPLLRYGAAQHGPAEEVLKKWGDTHPIGRIGTPEEIAKVVLFLWSPDSDFIIGQSIIADGGLGSIIL
ncbi:MAG: SDR family oxidoreductase [Saprospiraceae bacterium]|nr:SDR family oxidoreductase [Saprospiraceae bacterium]